MDCQAVQEWTGPLERRMQKRCKQRNEQHRHGQRKLEHHGPPAMAQRAAVPLNRFKKQDVPHPSMPEFWP